MDAKEKVINVLKKLGLVPFEDDDELEVMKVMNECTTFMKVTKLQLEKEYVSVACELFVSEDSDLEDIVKRCVVTLHQTKERFEKEMKGL